MTEKQNSTYSRRQFVKLSGKVTLGTALAASLFRGPLNFALAAVQFPEPDHQPLPGACFLDAQTEEEQLVAAMVDTIVPGVDSDPDGLIGAMETCAMNLIYDEFYPFVENLYLLLPLIESVTDDHHRNKKFHNLTLEQRTEVLSEAEERLPFIRLAYRFIRSSFYAGAYNLKGTTFMGWPGPNLGYLNHPDFTYGEPIGTELTEDGNLP